MSRALLIRWLVILSMAASTAAGVLIYLRAQPGELETSIRSNLLVRGRIDESAEVTVLRRIQLFDAASHRLDYVTVCIQGESGFQLAHLRRRAQHSADAGGNWTTIYLAWKHSDQWPTRP